RGQYRTIAADIHGIGVRTPGKGMDLGLRGYVYDRNRLRISAVGDHQVFPVGTDRKILAVVGNGDRIFAVGRPGWRSGQIDDENFAIEIRHETATLIRGYPHIADGTRRYGDGT